MSMYSSSSICSEAGRDILACENSYEAAQRKENENLDGYLSNTEYGRPKCQEQGKFKS